MRIMLVHMNESLLILGIMSGTSADGIDVAIIRMAPNMDTRPELVHFHSYPMPPRLSEPILRLAEPGVNEVDIMGALHVQLGHAYAAAALQAITKAGLHADDIAAIGCHGQTIRHRPAGKHPFSLQIGCASTIAERTGITTIADFRSRDIAAHGQGAPLVPFAHRLLFASDDLDTAVLNIGGIANITWLGRDGSTSGFDCGPGNMLMDGLMLALSDGRDGFDEDGELGAAGRVCEPLLAALMSHPFTQRRPPKSTGREEFGSDVLARILAWPELCDADRMATTAAFTVNCVTESVHFLPQIPQRWLVCGGGARNQHLMTLLGKKLAPANISTTDNAGMPSQAVEAASFALLARQTLLGQSNTLSTVTGAIKDVCGGSISPGKNWPSLLRKLPTWTR